MSLIKTRDDFQDPREYDDLFNRANTIFARWKEDGRFTIDDVVRVLHGSFHYLVSFEKGNNKLGIRRDGYVIITGAESLEEATAMAREKYDGFVQRVVPEWSLAFRTRAYRRGELARLDAREPETTS